MLQVICDICSKNATISSGFTVPKGWTDINISGAVFIKEYSNRCSTRKTICDICAIKVFKITEDTVQKDIKQQFEETAIDYLNELVGEAVQDAMENQ